MKRRKIALKLALKPSRLTSRRRISKETIRIAIFKMFKSRCDSPK